MPSYMEYGSVSRMFEARNTESVGLSLSARTYMNVSINDAESLLNRHVYGTYSQKRESRSFCSSRSWLVDGVPTQFPAFSLIVL
jgi:hypothetical protein